MVLLQVFFEVVNSGFSWFVHDMLPDLALCFSTTGLLSFGGNRFHPGSIRAPVTPFPPNISLFRTSKCRSLQIHVYIEERLHP